MIAAQTSEGTDQSAMPSLDRWLRFDAATKAEYEAEHGADRITHLRSTIFFGVLLYDAYIISNLALMPDVFWDSVFLRLIAVTPVALWIFYIVKFVSEDVREWLAMAGMLGAHAVPVYLFYATNAPLGMYMFGDLNLMLAYGNMLVALRFRQAVYFTAGAVLMTLVVIATKPAMVSNMQVAFTFQIVAASVFVLYANYLQEQRRCVDYCTARAAHLRAEKAETSSNALREMSKTDALTGLPNRRYLDERLEEWFDESSSISILMIDVDHFKLFNDTLGHPAGDDCLRKVASVLMLATQGDETFSARFGGEEFTVAVRDIGELEAARLASRIVKSIEAMAIAHPGRSDGVGVVTVSIGVAFKPWGRSSDKRAVLSQADEALYRAKRRGRNCFEITSKVEHPASGGV